MSIVTPKNVEGPIGSQRWTEGLRRKSNQPEEAELGHAADNHPAEKILSAGRKQSIVDLSATIKDTKVVDSNDKPLRRRYNPHENCILGNTGHGWKVLITGPSTARRADLMYWNSELTGGPLSGCYRLTQFHMHSNNEGSAHTVDGQSFPGEIHFLNWNCDKYKSFGEAASQPDGLAMLCVLLKIGKANIEVQKVMDLMSQITQRGQEAVIIRELDLANLLPAKSSYWTYRGSISTPPGNDSVIWIVCKEPITVSQEQIKAMHAIRSSSEGKVIPMDETKGILFKNFCPPPPLSTRDLRASRE